MSNTIFKTDRQPHGVGGGGEAVSLSESVGGGVREAAEAMESLVEEFDDEEER